MDPVRVATEEDARRVVELAGAMAAEAEGRRGAAEAAADGWRGSLVDHVSRWLPPRVAEGHRAWVASVDDRARGFALAHVQRWDDGGRRGVLDACFVEAADRGGGLGPRLLAVCLDWLAAEGCTGIDGAALPGDRTAKNFYESAGFKARLLTMHRSLE